MKSCYYLVLALLLLVITPVAAADMDSVINEIEIFNETFEDYGTSYITCYRPLAYGASKYPGHSILVSANIANLVDLSVIQIQGSQTYFSPPSGCPDVGRWPITLKVGDDTVGYGEYYYFKFYVGDTAHYKAIIDLEEFNPPASVVSIKMSDPPEGYGYLNYYGYNVDRGASYTVSNAVSDKPGYVVLIWDGKHGDIHQGTKVTVYEEHRWSNQLTVIDKLGPDNIPTNITTVSLIRDTPLGSPSLSSIHITDNSGKIYTNTNSQDITFQILRQYYPLQVSIDSYFTKIFNRTISLDPVGPGDPGDHSRTGTVTMTDLNGVRIHGFEVTAVNHYTGESYTVSTDTDVAVITLPMDRTVEIRNPQTGVYEVAPVGYYRFYGQKPGYKMLFDDGIKVAVMPEEYGSYKFCDIGVTADNGFTPTLRTGSVTMTDHNGTSISGFEVMAVNHYTGEEYTVSTDTDVAVITLPMDRTVEIRNPQTGVYEEAPVGYYTFYGQKPGYKMLHEDGIRVMVMPEKYGSYKLCDIFVSSESGPLTGKHQFQLRSWSDNSILQTGTISAKSRTTGIWYNTTVVNGLATLILPYDTSDAISEYAGHYYVYATSPGYEDNDYGVQIAVYPHTVSEIRSIHLYPIGGVLTPGNVTLRIQAISETGQGVPNAEIFIAGVLGAGKDMWDTYTTSWTGFLEVSVPGNSTYDIVARAAGYYDSSRRIEVFTEDPPIIEMYLYLSGAPTVEPTTEPTGWVTGPPTTQPTGGIPDEDDDSDGFMMESVRGIANLFGVSFGTGKTILGMLLALGIGTATAKHLRGGAQEFGMGMLGGVVLGVLIGLLPIWVLVLLVLIVGLWIGQRYMSGGDS